MIGMPYQQRPLSRCGHLQLLHTALKNSADVLAQAAQPHHHAMCQPRSLRLLLRSLHLLHQKTVMQNHELHWDFPCQQLLRSLQHTQSCVHRVHKSFEAFVSAAPFRHH